MRTTMNLARLIALSSLVVLAGCFSLSRPEPPQRHYVLGGDRVRDNGAPALDAAGLMVGVRRLRLASYLEAPFLVVRHGPNQVRYSEYNRWGEPLGGGINRAIAGYLVAGETIRGADVAPWQPRERYDYLIQLHVERFEGVAAADPAVLEGEVHLLASWEIIRQGDGAVLARGTTDYRERGWRVGDFAALVTSLDAGLSVMAAELASSLSNLGAPLAKVR